MQPLTLLVLEQALAWYAASPLRAQRGSLAVNLSTSCLADVALADQIQAACTRAGVSADRLILEITESTAMDRTADSFDTLTRLRLKGFRLSVDDFGTGYSSLAQLARLPLSEIKIDKSFVMRLLESDDARKIVDATIRLAKGMGLVSVAEGVEDAAVLEALAALGCELAQGYHISRPLPVAEFDAWLEARA
jgi:EAL domain-containing protein (putative c-di-GMP-specific phosphodiesterase class I)